MKINNKFKFIRSTIIMLSIIIFISIITNKVFSHKEVEFKIICIESGDTLWTIATMESQVNDYYKNKDIRYIINDIMEKNNLDSNNIKVDQTLQIPTI